MVRLINQKNYDKLGLLIKGFFGFQRHFTHIRNINYPELNSCIFALWHAHQFSLFGLEDKGHTNIMISNSADGEIVAMGVEMLGFKTVRGSTGRKGSITATKQLIERLQNNEFAAIMVDGPRGPARKVKGGIVRIAKNANVPIIPMIWYCPQKNFITLPSWDKMSSPIFDCKILNIYGEPIYVDPNTYDEDEKPIIDKIQASLEDLEKRAPELYKEAKKNKLWKKK